MSSTKAKISSIVGYMKRNRTDISREFIEEIRESMRLYGGLTDKQLRDIDNIISHFGIEVDECVVFTYPVKENRV